MTKTGKILGIYPVDKEPQNEVSVICSYSHLQLL